MQLGSGP
jgi:hypothetical protein